MSLTPTSVGAVLRLAEPAVFGPLRLAHLEVDLPAAPSVNHGAPLAAQQRRRGRLRALDLVCAEDLLGPWLHGPAGQDLRAQGVERLHIRLGPSHLTLAARLLVHTHRVWLTGRGRLAPVGPSLQHPQDPDPLTGLTLLLESCRVYGFAPVPAPLCLRDLVRTLLAGLRKDDRGAARFAIDASGPAEIRLDPIRLLLWHILPPAGYRIPDLSEDARLGVLLQDGRVVLSLRFAPEPAAEDPFASPVPHSTWPPAPALSARDRAAFSAAEKILATGDLRAAADAYRALLQARALPAARSRLLSILACSPATFDEAEVLAQAAERDDPLCPEALLALAAIEGARGQLERAAARYQALSELAGNTAEEVATAALVAGELLLLRGSAQPGEPEPVAGAGAAWAGPWLERAAAVTGGPASERAAEHLREIYNRQGRWEALAQLEERQLSLVPASAPGAREDQQRRHLRLAALYLERLNDIDRADAELDRALRLSERNPAAWELRARVCLGRKPPQQALAVAALDRAAEHSPPEGAAEIRTRAGALAERLEDHEGALRRYRLALEAVPDHTPALDRLADLLGRLGRLDEAKGAYESLLQRLPFGKNGDVVRRQALLALSRIALNLESDRPRARGYIGRALALGGDRDPEVLRAWADLEEQDGHLDKVDKALSRMEDLGVTDSMLRRAEVLLQLLRPGDAAAVAEQVLRARPEQGPQALRMLARARQSMGDSRGVREALEQLCQAAPEDRRTHLELGRILLTTGDLGAAREHLLQAGPEPAALLLLAEILTRQGDPTGLESVLHELIGALDLGGLGGLSAVGSAGTPVRVPQQRRSELALALGRLSELLTKQGRQDEALQPLQRAVSLLPVSEEAHLKIGEAALLLSRFPEARLAFEPLLQREGPLSPLLLGKLLALGELGTAQHPQHSEAARRCFRLALARGATGHDASRAWHGLIRLSDQPDPGQPAADALEDKARVLLEAAEDDRADESLGARAALLRAAAAIRRQQGRTGEAAALYERGLDLDHGHLPSLDALEELAAQAGDRSRLAEVLTRKARALASRPQDRKAVLGRLGRLYADELHRRDLARDVFRQTLALDPAFRPALVFLAEEAQDRGDTGAELAHLKRLASLPVKDTADAAPVTARDRGEIHARLAQLHRRAGRQEEAERQALLALGLYPEHAGALALLEERYTSTERLAELADILGRRAAIAVHAVDRREALLRRAQILDRELGLPDKALIAYHDLVRIAPDPEACVRLAALALLQESFDQIQDVAPVVGRALLRAGRGAEAIPILEHATARGAGEPLFALLAEAYESVADYEHAADAWAAAGQAADPERHARALERADRLEEAMATWVSVAASEPQLAAQAQREALALARRAMLERPQDAAAWARRLLELTPGDPAALAQVIAARPPAEVPALLDLLGRRLTKTEAADTWLRAAQALPEDPALAGPRRELLRRSIDLDPRPESLLCWSGLLEGPDRREALQQALSIYPGDPHLTLGLLAASDPSNAHAIIEQGLAALEHAHDPAGDPHKIAQARAALLVGAAVLSQSRGAASQARDLLRRAGDNPEALHRRVRLDLPRLGQAQAGSEEDLLPVLLTLYEHCWATPEEMRALGQLYTLRGQYGEAAALQLSVGGPVDELLIPLEEAQRDADLIAAVMAHARARPLEARALYRRAAHLAGDRLGDLHQAASLLEQAAHCQGPLDEAATLFSQAGSLWNQLGERERGASALSQALSAGGERTPGVLLALGDYSFDRSDWDASARHYRRALAVEQVAPRERGRVRMRLAAIERRRGNPGAEEQELAAAVEAGAGATAWPALAALFRTQGESARLGAALLAWADHESGASRLALLRQAAGLVTPSLLPRVDDELTKLDADDEEVRDRRRAWLAQIEDQHGLAQALVRDVDKSEGDRRAGAARELARLCEQMGDQFAAATAWRVVLEATLDPQKDSQAALSWLERVRESGAALPEEAGAALRALLIQKGRLGDVVIQIDQQLAALPEDDARQRLDLMREAAELVESLGDQEDAAARWLQILALRPPPDAALDGAHGPPSAQTPVALSLRARHLLRVLVDSHRADAALEICEREIARAAHHYRGAGALREAPVPAALRVVHAEVLAHHGRTEEAIAQLELVLVREPDHGLAHVLLGMLLGQSPQPADAERGLSHLLQATGPARAPALDHLEPQDAGECALLAAELLLSGVAPPAALASEGRDPQALLLRAADLLPQDRRPLEILLRNAGTPDRAIVFLERLLDLTHDSHERARLLLQEGQALVQLGRMSEAEVALTEALSCAPEMPEVMAALRGVYVHLHDLQRAQDLCRRELAEAGPETGDARQAELYLELGLLCDKRGDEQGALEAYRSAGELGAYRGHEAVARMLTDREEWTEAAEAAGKAAALAPDADQGLAMLWAAELALRGGDEDQARRYLQQAAADPQGQDTSGQVWGLADLCYRLGHYQRARALYDQCGDLLPDVPADVLEILRRRAELADLAGDGEAAEQLYQRLLGLCTGSYHGPLAPPAGFPADPAELGDRGRLAAIHAAQELTRIYEQRGDYAGAHLSLMQVAALLPGHASDDQAAVERLEQVRLHLAWLAHQMGDLKEARRQLQYLLAERPDHRDGLQLLLTVYRQGGEPGRAAEVLDRLVSLAEDPAERAGLLFERAALYETQLEQPERALELYQQALDVLPGHAPSLRRLIVCHLRDASGIGAAAAVRELEEAGQPLLDCQVAAGLGLALAGDDEGADRLLRGAAGSAQRSEAPSIDDIAVGLCAIGLPPPGDLSLLDEAIAAAMRAVGGTAALPELVRALQGRLRGGQDGLDLGARQVLGRLAELRDEPAARVHLGVLAYLFADLGPGGYASQRLEVLGTAPATSDHEDPMPEAGRGPLRAVLKVLGRHVLGLPTPPLPLSPELGQRLRPLAQGMGFSRLDVAVVDELDAADHSGEPARCDPSLPPRLRLLRHVAADSAQARFAAVRALHLLNYGVPLLLGRGVDDVAGLLRATARLFVPPAGDPALRDRSSAALRDPMGESWSAELAALGVKPEILLPDERLRLEEGLVRVLEQMAHEPHYLAQALPAYIEAAQRSADRQALVLTGDLRAALCALSTPQMLSSAESRHAALRRTALAALIAFADRHYQ